MTAPTNTLLIEGSFEELVDELAQYLDALKDGRGDGLSVLRSECAQLLQDKKKDDALKKLVIASAALNAAPEREFIAAYNLLIHLVRQSPSANMYLPPMCKNLSNPVTSSPTNSSSLSLSVLATIFNVLQPDNDSRYHVFLAILHIIKTSFTFDNLKPQLKHVDLWLAQWRSGDKEQRKLYLAISNAAQDCGDDDTAYTYLIKALRTWSTEDATNQEARELSLRTLKTALMRPAHFDFHDLTALDSVQALRKSDPIHYELLEIFNSELFDELHDFYEEHPGFVENDASLDAAQLTRKMRLLTLTSLAAQATGQARSLPYAQIAKALQVPLQEVEVWVIDVIRAGLVEGKLSQLSQTFLIHRATYRVFGENQWRELAARLDMWRSSLVGVLAVIQQEREQGLQHAEAKTAQQAGAGGQQAGSSRGGRRVEASVVDVDV